MVGFWDKEGEVLRGLVSTGCSLGLGTIGCSFEMGTGAGFCLWEQEMEVIWKE